MKIFIAANAFHNFGGGDVIFSELGKRWSRLGAKVTIATNQKGKEFCLHRGISIHQIIVWGTSVFDSYSVVVSLLIKTFNSVVNALKIDYSGYDAIFSMSDYWPDIFPAVIAKIKNPHIKWIAACYLIHPAPSLIQKGRTKKCIAWIVQQLSLRLVSRYADAVWTASQADTKGFYNNKQLTRKTVLAIRGGIDLHLSASASKQLKRYDAVFVGRFHEQKCIDELLDIWKEVVEVIPKARLGLIGGGLQEKYLRTKAATAGLNANVSFLGVMDGAKKVAVLKSSRMFISASRHDSGNIALDEVLACGILGIIYDLPKMDYPKGVIKISVGDSSAFRDSIVRLLQSKSERARLGKEGFAFIKQFDWNVKARQTLTFIRSL